MFLKLIQIVIVSTLFVGTLELTALTTANCPVDFDINSFNITTSSTSMVNLIFGNLYSK